MDSGLALRAPRNDEKQKSLPSFATAGLLARKKFCGRYATQRLPNLKETEAAFERAG
jgi:hypothetical protein